MSHLTIITQEHKTLREVRTDLVNLNNLLHEVDVRHPGSTLPAAGLHLTGATVATFASAAWPHILLGDAATASGGVSLAVPEPWQGESLVVSMYVSAETANTGDALLFSQSAFSTPSDTLPTSATTRTQAVSFDNEQDVLGVQGFVSVPVPSDAELMFWRGGRLGADAADTLTGDVAFYAARLEIA